MAPPVGGVFPEPVWTRRPPPPPPPPPRTSPAGRRPRGARPGGPWRAGGQAGGRAGARASSGEAHARIHTATLRARAAPVRESGPIGRRRPFPPSLPPSGRRKSRRPGRREPAPTRPSRSQPLAAPRRTSEPTAGARRGRPGEARGERRRVCGTCVGSTAAHLGWDGGDAGTAGLGETATAAGSGERPSESEPRLRRGRLLERRPAMAAAGPRPPQPSLPRTPAARGPAP